jgi:4-amino-4-deoxy-L-arabinose transferase
MTMRDGGGTGGTGEQRRRGAFTRGTVILGILLGLLLFAWPLAQRLPLIDPDEGLHAAIAQEMIDRGDYVTPVFLGEPFLDKPILFFWTQIASLRLIGSSEAGVRLPGLLFGLFGVITTALLARTLFDPCTGLVAGAMYATMLLPLAEAQVAVHDVALVPWTNLALLFLWRADRAGKPDPDANAGAAVSARRRVVGFLAAAALCLGLAILTKGLSGVALVGIAAAGTLAFTRRLTVTRMACLAVCVIAGVAVAAPWYLAMEHANPG